MTWLEVVGLISTITMLIPILSILALRLAWYKSFPALVVYFTMLFLFNFFSQPFLEPQVNKNFLHYFGLVNNFLHAPLILTFMTYFSHTSSFRKKLQIAVPVLLVMEVLIIAINGFNVQSATIAMAPGLLIVLIYSVYFFIRQVKISIVHQKASGKACMVAALLFAYGGYAFVYIVYYLMNTPHIGDTYTVYYFIGIFSSILLSTGIFLERRRVSVLEELQTTREELKMIYGGANKA